MAVSPSTMSLPRARRFDWNNLGVRAVSAIVLALGALFLMWVDARAFLVLVSIAVALISIEWGGMAAPKAPVRVASVVTLSTLIVTFLGFWGYYGPAWACVGVGALAAAAVARGVSERAVDAAYGVLYIAPACLALIWLRAHIDLGAWWTLLLFAVTWSADIFAFLVGSALKGPKLWPRFSPNKTWSGFFGGLVAASLAAPGVVWLSGAIEPASKIRVSLAAACVIGLIGGLATMAGDLWESMLKRRFGVKDSGDLIPGHGGLLDRVDGLMFAIIAIAAARMAVHVGWGR